MESIKRVFFGLTYFALIFIGTAYLYPIDKGLALLFNLFCFGIMSSFLAYQKQRSAMAWFFAGFFGGILGLAAVLSVRPKEASSSEQ